MSQISQNEHFLNAASPDDNAADILNTSEPTLEGGASKSLDASFVLGVILGVVLGFLLASII